MDPRLDCINKTKKTSTTSAADTCTGNN